MDVADAEDGADEAGAAAAAVDTYWEPGSVFAAFAVA
jgi:hypothetical protein